MQGTLSGNFFQLHEAGCIQTGADAHKDERKAYDKFGLMLYTLMQTTDNNPCEGCPAFDNGKCKAYQQYHSTPARKKILGDLSTQTARSPKPLEDFPGMTTKQIAQKLGVSKNEVRRMKVHGQIK